jgi:sugar phosphate isomerase/epimerase
MHLNRRQILAGGLGLPMLLKAGAKIDSSWISVITDEIAKSPEDAIAFATKYGLKHVELRGVPGRRGRYDALTDEELKQASKQFSDAGLEVSFFNSGLLKHGLPGTTTVNPRHTRPSDVKRLDSRMEALARAINAAQHLGVNKLRVFAFFRVEDPLALMPRIADIMGPMVELAKQEKVTLLIENEAACNVATCAELAVIAKLLPSPNVGINWDPLNGTRFNETPMPDGYNKLPKKRIGNVQIKGKSILTGYNQLLDWRSIFDTMIADGYRGKFGLETHIFGEGQIQASHDSMQEILRVVESS